MTTEIVEVPDLVNPGIFPTPSGDSAAYNRASRAWADQQQPFANSLVEIAESAHANSLATAELAHVATQKAQEAEQSAQSAADDARRLVTLDALWLGALAADPATGRDGVPLVAGNAYVNTATGYIRAYNGAAWAQGVSAVAGVTSLNGQIGDLALKTVGGRSLFGVGDIRFETPAEKQFRFYTENMTLTVPAGLSVLRFYAGGRGGNGAYRVVTQGGAGGGGGGGFAFGDISVAEGNIVSVEIVAGVASVKLNGVTVATANPGANGTAATGAFTGGAGGTASITAAVTGGGAYSGGAGGGGSATGGYAGAGGGSCGSPLGNGFPGGACGNPGASNYASSGGGGIGGAGAWQGGGGGAGEAGAVGIGGGCTSDGTWRGIFNAFSDPLIKHAIAGRYATGAVGVGGNVPTSGPGFPAGDFAGGGGTAIRAANALAMAGGLMGGGSGAGGGNTGGAGGYGGGGGGFASASAGSTGLGGPGGAAFCIFYY